MNEEYDPLTADLIERLFAASRKAANDEQDLLVEAADALEAQATKITALRADAESWRKFQKILRQPMTRSHGLIRVVEVCPMYGDEKQIQDVQGLVDARGKT